MRHLAGLVEGDYEGVYTQYITPLSISGKVLAAKGTKGTVYARGMVPFGLAYRPSIPFSSALIRLAASPRQVVAFERK